LVAPIIGKLIPKKQEGGLHYMSFSKGIAADAEVFLERFAYVKTEPALNCGRWVSA
jgi:hypothetical protein